jgi:imidazolonepropionase-like amidohydrolase
MIVFSNCKLFDGLGCDYREPINVLIEGRHIREVSDAPIYARGARTIDVQGLVLMPGLIDAHAHPTIVDPNIRALEDVPQTLLAARASVSLRAMLNRGFTSVRDAGGGDHGLKRAVEDGYFVGPRLFISGRPLTQTGGHADNRRRTDDPHQRCPCASALALQSHIADGVDGVRTAAREELRRGADQLKVMISGGVISQHDPLESVQYAAFELKAIVEEAQRWNTYAMAHAYTGDAVRHGLAAGVRTFEHANLIDADAATKVAQAGAFVVPTLATYHALAHDPRAGSLTPESKDKLRAVRAAGLAALEICTRAGAPLGFGTDLLGDMQDQQTLEFQIRREVQSPADILRSATSINGEILSRHERRIGAIVPGAVADLLVVDGDPLKDVDVFDPAGSRLRLIMQGGRLHKDELSVGYRRLRRRRGSRLPIG